MSKSLREILLHLRASGIAATSAPGKKAGHWVRPPKSSNRGNIDGTLLDLLKSCAIPGPRQEVSASGSSSSSFNAAVGSSTNAESTPPTIQDYAELLQCISNFPEMKLVTLPIVAQALAAVANAAQASREGLRPVDGLLACLIAFSPPLRDYSAHRDALIAALSEYIDLTPIDDLLKVVLLLAPISRNLRRRLLQTPLTVPQLVQLLQLKSTVRGRFLEGIAADCVGQWKLRRPFALSSLKQAALWVVTQQIENASEVEHRTLHSFCENLMQEVLLEFREIRTHLTPLENFQSSTASRSGSNSSNSSFGIQIQLLHQYAFYIVAVAQYAQPPTQRSFIVCEAVKHCRQSLSHSTLPLVVGNALFGVEGILCGLRYLKGESDGVSGRSLMSTGGPGEGAEIDEGRENHRHHSLMYRNTLSHLATNPISKTVLGPSIYQELAHCFTSEARQTRNWPPSKVASLFRQLLQECQDQLAAGVSDSILPFQSLVELMEQSIQASEEASSEDIFTPTLSMCAVASQLLLQKMLSVQEAALKLPTPMVSVETIHSLVERHCATLSRYADRQSGFPDASIAKEEHATSAETGEATASTDEELRGNENGDRVGIEGLLVLSHRFLQRVSEHDQGATPFAQLSTYAADLITWLIQFVSSEGFVQCGAYSPRLETVLFAARSVVETVGDLTPPDLVPAVWRAFSVPLEPLALESSNNWREGEEAGVEQETSARTLPFENFTQCRAWFQVCTGLNLWSPLYLNPVFEWANQHCSVQQNAQFLSEILSYGAATNNDEHKQLHSFSTLVDSCIRELLTLTAPTENDSYYENQNPSPRSHQPIGEKAHRKNSHTNALTSPQLLHLLSAVFDAATLKHRYGLRALELQLLSQPRPSDPSGPHHVATGIFLQSSHTLHLEQVARSALQYWIDRVSGLSDVCCDHGKSSMLEGDSLENARALLQSMYQLTTLLVRVELKGPDLERGVNRLRSAVPQSDLMRLLTEESIQTSSMFRKIEADGGSLDETFVLDFADYVMRWLKGEQEGRGGATKTSGRASSKVFTHLAHCKAFHTSDRGGALLSELLRATVDMTVKQAASHRRGGYQGRGSYSTSDADHADSTSGRAHRHGKDRRAVGGKSHASVGIDEKEISVAFLVITYCETRVAFGAAVDEELVARLLDDLIPFLAGNPQLNNNFDTLCGLLWCCCTSEGLLSKVSPTNLQLISQALVDRLEYADADTSCGNTRALRRLLQAVPKLQGRGCDDLFELLSPQSGLSFATVVEC
jgi:hypothetical protein